MISRKGSVVPSVPLDTWMSIAAACLLAAGWTLSPSFRAGLRTLLRIAVVYLTWSAG